MNSFRVGQKVVCVDDGPCPIAHTLKKGRVYTVSQVIPEFPSIHVEEVYHPNPKGFWASRFRPIVEPGTETGMSVLRELLNTQDQPVEVDA